MGFFTIGTGVSPTPPSTGLFMVYPKAADKRLYHMDELGVEHRLSIETDSTEILGNETVPVVVASNISGSVSQLQIQFLKSSGGMLDGPTMTNGSFVGQEKKLQGTSDTDFIRIKNSSNIRVNGQCDLKNGSAISFLWGGTTWTEQSRNDV